MSVALILILSLIYLVLLFVVMMYNHLKRRQTLFKSAALVLGVSTVAHLGNYLWLKSLPLEQVLGVHYLFFAGIQIIIAFGLFYINREKLNTIMTITIALLAAEALLSYAVHIDRNIIALNGALVPNTSGSSQWLLWEIRNYVSLMNALTMLFAISFANVYQVSKNLLNTEAFIIWETVEKYLNGFEPSDRLNRINVFMEVALQNLNSVAGNANQDKHRASVGITMLNAAIKESCYEPERDKPVGFFGRFIYRLRD